MSTGDRNGGDGLNGHTPENSPETDAGHNVVRLPGPEEREQLKRDKLLRERLISGPAATAEQEPLVRLPPATLAMTCVFLIVHFVLGVFLPENDQFRLVYDLGFVPGRYTGIEPLGWQGLVSPLTYALLHGSWLHVGMNALMMIAFGSGVERWMGSARMIAFFVLCSLTAALVQFAVDPSSTNPVIGASGGISGLFAAALVMLRDGGSLPVGRRGILPLILLWIGITVVFGMLGAPGDQPVAWPAHLGGFLGGFLILKTMRRLWP